MPAAGGDGVVTWFIASGNPTDLTGVRLQRFQVTSTSASIGAVADAVITTFGLTVTATAYSLMAMNVTTARPIIEARSVTVVSSVIPNGAAVLLVPGT